VNEEQFFRRHWHAQHVEMGKCPAISSSRAWCDRDADHTGTHGSPRVPDPDHPVGPDNPLWHDWHD
jgi:hypothetical protein